MCLSRISAIDRVAIIVYHQQADSSANLEDIQYYIHLFSLYDFQSSVTNPHICNIYVLGSLLTDCI
jgi:hypothetical protein